MGHMHFIYIQPEPDLLQQLNSYVWLLGWSGMGISHQPPHQTQLISCETNNHPQTTDQRGDAAAEQKEREDTVQVTVAGAGSPAEASEAMDDSLRMRNEIK